jgi:hypothetical protein
MINTFLTVLRQKFLIFVNVIQKKGLYLQSESLKRLFWLIWCLFGLKLFGTLIKMRIIPEKGTFQPLC